MQNIYFLFFYKWTNEKQKQNSVVISNENTAKYEFICEKIGFSWLEGASSFPHKHTQTHTHINPKQIVQIGKKSAYWIKQWLISLQDCSEYSVLISIQLHVLWQQRNFYICFFTRTRCHTHKQPENMQKTATDESKQRNKINWREDSDNGICIRIYYKNNETHTERHSAIESCMNVRK